MAPRATWYPPTKGALFPGNPFSGQPVVTFSKLKADILHFFCLHSFAIVPTAMRRTPL